MSKLAVDSLYVHADDLGPTVDIFHGLPVRHVTAEPAELGGQVRVYTTEEIVNPTPQRGDERIVQDLESGEFAMLPPLASYSQGAWPDYEKRESGDAITRAAYEKDKRQLAEADEELWKMSEPQFSIPDNMVICGDFLMRNITAYLDMREARPSIRTAEADRRAEAFVGGV